MNYARDYGLGERQNWLSAGQGLACEVIEVSILLRNFSSQKNICIFAHFSDICNRDIGVLGNVFPQLHIVLCPIFFLILVHIVFIDLLPFVG